jgi:hypothetical protein
MVQRERRRDPYPFSWEVPFLAVLAVCVCLVLGVHLGRAVANLLAGGGWGWPGRGQLLVSVPKVLDGHSGAGLVRRSGPLAGPTALRTWIVVAELALTAAAMWFGVVVLRRWGPWRVAGMASPAEVAQLMGVARLRKAKAVVRPDLYGKRRDA